MFLKQKLRGLKWQWYNNLEKKTSKKTWHFSHENKVPKPKQSLFKYNMPF